MSDIIPHSSDMRGLLQQVDEHEQRLKSLEKIIKRLEKELEEKELEE